MFYLSAFGEKPFLGYIKFFEFQNKKLRKFFKV